MFSNFLFFFSFFYFLFVFFVTADRSNNSPGCCNPLGLAPCPAPNAGLMVLGSHVNDADDNVDAAAASDDVYAGYVFISVTAVSVLFKPKTPLTHLHPSHTHTDSHNSLGPVCVWPASNTAYA